MLRDMLVFHWSAVIGAAVEATAEDIQPADASIAPIRVMTPRVRRSLLLAGPRMVRENMSEVPFPR
jgi:hypothetical protein